MCKKWGWYMKIEMNQKNNQTQKYVLLSATDRGSKNVFAITEKLIEVFVEKSFFFLVIEASSFNFEVTRKLGS